MQQQPQISAISRIPPPSYDEATGPPGAPKDYAAPVGPYVYGQYPQAVPYPPPTQGYQDPNIFYPSGVQPGPTTIYVTALPDQNTTEYIVHRETVQRQPRSGSCIGGCIWILMLTVFAIMFIKILLYMSYYSSPWCGIFGNSPPCAFWVCLGIWLRSGNTGVTEQMTDVSVAEPTER